MGNFYSNFAVYGAKQDQVAEVMEISRRRSLVTPTVNRITIVFDEAADDLDDSEIDLVGSLLSKQLASPVLAAIVADDDELLLWLFENGERISTYYSRGDKFTPVPICRAFKRNLAIPFAWLVMGMPGILFETTRHYLLAKLLGIPTWCVASGYRYISEGDELPSGLEMEDMISTGRAE